jgi:hypothetical protein
MRIIRADELGSARHQAPDECDIAREAIQFGDDKRGLQLLGFLKRCC